MYNRKDFLKLILSIAFIFGVLTFIIPGKLVALNNEIIEQAPKISFFSTQNLEKLFSPERSSIYLLILAFIIGIFTSFTPCVYPMIPITMGILQSQASSSLYRNFLLSVSYVLGMSTIYAVFGYIAATSTVIFGQWLSNPWIILFVVAFFIYLAFSMFGFYEIKMLMKSVGYLFSVLSISNSGFTFLCCADRCRATRSISMSRPLRIRSHLTTPGSSSRFSPASRLRFPATS